MNEDEFYLKLKKRIAEITIGASALRNQGLAGLVEATRKYLFINIAIDDFFESLGSEDAFIGFLDRHTQALMASYPTQAKQNFGAARKGLNLFFREIVYNTFFSAKYFDTHNITEINKAITYLEVPLDSHVAKKIIENSNNKLPLWGKIKTLTSDNSKLYQSAASQIALNLMIPRVHLDLIYWRG